MFTILIYKFKEGLWWKQYYKEKTWIIILVMEDILKTSNPNFLVFHEKTDTNRFK